MEPKLATRLLLNRVEVRRMAESEFALAATARKLDRSDPAPPRASPRRRFGTPHTIRPRLRRPDGQAALCQSARMERPGKRREVQCRAAIRYRPDRRLFQGLRACDRRELP